MALPRFFASGSHAPGDVIVLSAEDRHHAVDVLRLRDGDRVTIITATGSWNAELVDASLAQARVRIVGVSGEPLGALAVEVTVLQALIKSAKFDTVVEKTIELGARRIVPVLCERSNVGASDSRLERWRRIARSAAMQSRQPHVAEIGEPTPFADAVRTHAQRGPVIVAWERAPTGSLAAAAREALPATALAITVGPEGSLSDDEIAAARANGCLFASLGPTILRTETAAAALLAAIAAVAGWW